MALNTLKDVYIDQLQDIYSANRQSLEATRKLADKASDGELKSALKDGVEGIERGIETLKPIIEGHDAKPTGEFCKGMEGIVKEVDAHVLDTEFGDDSVRDAMIISQYQRMTHYAIAGYGCVLAFAKRLELAGEVSKLAECLDQTYEGDRRMTAIAVNDVNKVAA
ncbi:MAG: ferritin-like domain-containing protein [Erythrobacter sp.]|nr:ferritin-like domain-containing protein [Erythrobacter sp.]NCQ63552.1 ferritin-like domain-containing protein [Alphaproteobacteria bacterium]